MVGKNILIDIAKRAQRPRPNFSDAAWKVLDISPPIDSKITKLRSAGYTFDNEMDKILDEGLKLYMEEYPSLGTCHNFYSKSVKVQKTPPKGGFYSWHCEQKDGESVNRVLAWTIYLNDIPEGEGETEFLELGMKLRPKKGTVCLFPASWTHTHRGNPVYTTDKYIATGWFYLTQ